MSSSEPSLKMRAREILEEYKNREPEILDWTVTKDSVRVHTKKYSSIVLACAVAIIGGSLSIPFLVGERIAGVDPFQFVTFSWLVAGAFLVGAKSRYVENWPWHDFLRGQVVCRSVLELAEASNVTKQAVLLYLLHHEFRKRLVFGGPYHSIFRQRTESGTGFSIDIPVDYATVLAAGFIVLEVRETKDTEPRVRTVLHDTRENILDSTEGKVLVSELVEEVTNNKGQRHMSRCKRIRLTLENDPLDSEDIEVLGHPTTNCIFV